MPLNNLEKITTTPAKRVGRGLASGKGKTAGRGTKGQKSRSGYNLPRRFEGGQTSLIQRLPKVRGFRSRYAKPLTLDIARVEVKFTDGEEVNLKTLTQKNLIKNTKVPVKIVGKKITKNLRFSDVNLTKALLEDYKKNLANNKAKTIEKPEKPEVPEVPKVLKKSIVKKNSK